LIESMVYLSGENVVQRNQEGGKRKRKRGQS